MAGGLAAWSHRRGPSARWSSWREGGVTKKVNLGRKERGKFVMVNLLKTNE